MGKEQFNARIPKLLKENACTVAAKLGWSREELAQLGLKALMGATDKTEKRKIKLAQETAKELNLSFNYPDCQHDQELLAA